MVRTNTSATQWSVAALRLRALAWYESLARIALLVPASMTQVLSDLSTQLSSSSSGKAIRSHESMGREQRSADSPMDGRRAGAMVALRGLTITKHIITG